MSAPASPPVSWQMRAVGGVFRLTKRRRFADPEGGDALLQRAKKDPAPPARLRQRLDVEDETVDGFAVHRVRRPGAGDAGPVVVYLHGGAYVNEIVRQHWDFVAGLVEGVDPALDLEAWVPIYGLAPDHTMAEARALVATLLQRLADAGRSAYLMGDSAGGGLALVAAQEAVAAGHDHVRGLTVMAPWVDLAMANPEVDLVEPTDPWLARAALHRVAEVWAGEEPVASPGVSPLAGEMGGLPPVEIWVGTRDVTQPDSRLLAERLRAAGVGVAYHELAGGIHVVPLLPVPEGRRAARTIRTRLQDCLLSN